jgi:hypothetical protein
MCYSKQESQARAAIEKIRALLPGLSIYLGREMTQVLSFFTEAFGNDILTLSYHATSPSESANHTVKQYLPSRIDDLAKIRECDTLAYQIKALCVMH